MKTATCLVAMLPLATLAKLMSDVGKQGRVGRCWGTVVKIWVGEVKLCGTLYGKFILDAFLDCNGRKAAVGTGKSGVCTEEGGETLV